MPTPSGEDHEPVRWGILGAARIARTRVLPALQASPWCAVHAVASRQEGVGRELAEAFGAARVHHRYEDLLADPLVEAVYIPLPNHLHIPYALQAVANGKHVLCEKPLALTAVEAAALREAPAGIQIAEAFMVRHQPRWIALRELLRSGAQGRARALHSLLSFCMTDADGFRNHPAHGGGAIYDMGCYAVMAARYMFEAEPVRVMAMADLDPATGADRLSSVMLDFGEGRHAAFTVSTAMALSQSLHVVCERGFIELPHPYAPVPAQKALIHIDTGLTHEQPVRQTLSFDDVDQFEHQVTNFARAVRGIVAPPFGLEDAIANLRAIDAIRASMTSGQAVRLT